MAKDSHQKSLKPNHPGKNSEVQNEGKKVMKPELCIQQKLLQTGRWNKGLFKIKKSKDMYCHWNHTTRKVYENYISSRKMIAGRKNFRNKTRVTNA